MLYVIRGRKRCTKPGVFNISLDHYSVEKSILDAGEKFDE